MGAPLTAAEARRQARAEGLTLLRSESNAAGFQGVTIDSSKAKSYVARVRRGGEQVSIGLFATAEEAALAFARTPEGKAAAAATAAAPAPLTAAEARRQAEAEGLTLLRCESNVSGFKGVWINSGKAKPYQAKVTRGGKQVHLSSFATAEEAALAFARSPEGTAAAAAAAAAPAPLSAAEARRQADAEGLTLLRSEGSAAGFQGVYMDSNSNTKPYVAKVRRGGKQVRLGYFATAEEAALAYARSPEGRAVAAAAAAAPAAPLTAAEARRQAEAEGLTLLRSESSATGFQGVTIESGSKVKPYQAKVRRGGEKVYLGCFATAEEAALAYARTPEGRAAAAAAAAAPAPLTAAEARRQAEVEGLTLLRSESNASGFHGVHSDSSSKINPYKAQVQRGGKQVRLGRFATAEEAALAFARTPEARAAVAAAAAAPAPPRAARARGQDIEAATSPAVRTAVPVPKQETPPPPLDAEVKEEEAPPAWPDGAVVKVEVKAEPSLKQEPPPAMPDGALVKEEAWPGRGETSEMLAEAGTRSGVGRKRRRPAA